MTAWAANGVARWKVLPRGARGLDGEAPLRYFGVAGAAEAVVGSSAGLR